MDKRIKLVVWTSRATKDLEKITKFYVNLYGHPKARQIATKLRQSTEVLQHENVDTSKIGTIDDTFTHLKRKNYRKLIEHHCKITYREGRTKIYVIRVFDMRQNPKKNK